LNGIRTHDSSVRAGEDISCLRPRGHYDRHSVTGLQKYICISNNIPKPTNYVKSRVYKICVYLLHLEYIFPFFLIYDQCSFIPLVKVWIPRFSLGSLCSIALHFRNMRENVWFFLEFYVPAFRGEIRVAFVPSRPHEVCILCTSSYWRNSRVVYSYICNFTSRSVKSTLVLFVR
jgi:hypothetical protein